MLEALQRLLLSALNPTGTDRERDMECSLVRKIANIQMFGPFGLLLSCLDPHFTFHWSNNIDFI